MRPFIIIPGRLSDDDRFLAEARKLSRARP